MRLPADICYPFVKLGAKIFGHFNLEEISPEEAMKTCTLPIIFIHGDKDDFVLISNLDPVYNACAAEKEKHIIHGAEHAVSVFWFPEEYWETVDKFLEKHLYSKMTK